MPFEFKRLNEKTNINGNSTLLYGAAKSGKTHFISTAGSRSLILDNGNGLETIESPHYKKQNPDYNPIIVRIPTEALDSKPRSYDAICDAIDEALEKVPNDFDTLILDDASAFKLSAAFKAAETAQETGKSKDSKDRVKKYNIIVSHLPEYQVEMSYVLQFLAGTIELLCKQHGKNFILNCHERVSYKSAGIGEQPVPSVYKPAFTGVDRNPDQIAGLFDWVLHTESQSGNVNGVPTRFHYILTSGNDSVMAAMRGVPKGMFPERILNPNYLKMLEVYRSGGVYK